MSRLKFLLTVTLLSICTISFAGRPPADVTVSDDNQTEVTFETETATVDAELVAPLPSSSIGDPTPGKVKRSRLGKRIKATRADRRAARRATREKKKSKEPMSPLEVTTLLLIIIAILLPPLAVGLYDGITNRFWISLILWLLFYIPGLIYALIVILG